MSNVLLKINVNVNMNCKQMFCQVITVCLESENTYTKLFLLLQVQEQGCSVMALQMTSKHAIISSLTTSDTSTTVLVDKQRGHCWPCIGSVACCLNGNKHFAHHPCSGEARLALYIPSSP